MEPSRAAVEVRSLDDLDVLPFSLPDSCGRGSQTIYAKSGCNNCHGSQGQGSKRAPALRVAGRWIDGVVLAARLETSGPRMARRAREMKIPGPSLAEEDIDVLVRFLNALE